MATTPPASPPAPPIDLDDVRAAAARLRGTVHRTPVLRSRSLDALAGGSLHLKAEHLQRIGAFKIRGAVNAVAALDPEVRARGVVAFSSGNHAQAVALAATTFGIPATIVLPADAPAVKREATEGYGATIVPYDRLREDRAAIASRLAAEHGATLVPPYDDVRVMAGQGTVALELLEDVPDLDVLVVPVGGGGLLGGCATVARALRPDLRIVGVEPATRRAARDALELGRVVSVPVPDTLLDGQRSPEIGALPLAAFRAHVDQVVGVEDDEVLAAMAFLLLRCKQVVEPSGACALAAVLSGRVAVDGRRVGIVLSGGNVGPEALRLVLDRG